MNKRTLFIPGNLTRLQPHNFDPKPRIGVWGICSFYLCQTFNYGMAAAFDCFGFNNSCAMSHVKCDTGYDPFCEHFPGPPGMIGICTCDKDCTSAADCSNVGADGCPPMSYPMCDTFHKVCVCFGGPPSGSNYPEKNDST